MLRIDNMKLKRTTSRNCQYENETFIVKQQSVIEKVKEFPEIALNDQLPKKRRTNMKEKKIPEWAHPKGEQMIRKEVRCCGINSLAFVVLEPELYFLSLYLFRYLLIYPFSQEFDTISCTFQELYRLIKKNQITEFVYTYQNLQAWNFAGGFSSLK